MIVSIIIKVVGVALGICAVSGCILFFSYISRAIKTLKNDKEEATPGREKAMRALSIVATCSLGIACLGIPIGLVILAVKYWSLQETTMEKVGMVAIDIVVVLWAAVVVNTAYCILCDIIKKEPFGTALEKSSARNVIMSVGVGVLAILLVVVLVFWLVL